MKTTFKEFTENAKYKYYGGICKLNDGLFLFFKIDEENITDGFPISDFDEIYKNLTDYQISLVDVSMFDGTENLTIENVLNRKDFNDIVYSIKDIDTISIGNNETAENVSIINLIENGDFIDVLLDLIDNIK